MCHSGVEAGGLVIINIAITVYRNRNSTSNLRTPLTLSLSFLYSRASPRRPAPRRARRCPSRWRTTNGGWRTWQRSALRPPRLPPSR